MSELELIHEKISKEKIKLRTIIIKEDTTNDEVVEFLRNNSLVDLLVKGIHWFNNNDFDRFLCSLDFDILKLERIFEPIGCNALQLTCFLVLPEISKKIIDRYPEQISKFSKENYSALSIAQLTIDINNKMEDVVLKMLDFPNYCNLKQIHNINKNTAVYIWQYACKCGYKSIVEKLYDECLEYFNLDESTDLENSTPLCDLICNDISRIAVDLIKNHRNKCFLDKVVQGRTALLYSLLKGNKLATALIACNYDDCSFSYKDPNGLTAFELLIAYGFQGVITDILETRRDLYYTNFINNKAKTPFELALYYKNWDLAALLVAYKYVNYDELVNTKIMDIPLKQYLTLHNETDLIKFFNYVESKFAPKPKINENDPGWQKIKELGLESLVRDIIKDPISFTENAKKGNINLPNNLTFSSSLNNHSLNSKPNPKNTINENTKPKDDITIERKIRGRKPKEAIKLEIKPNQDSNEKTVIKKRGRPRKVKPEE